MPLHPTTGEREDNADDAHWSESRTAVKAEMSRTRRRRNICEKEKRQLSAKVRKSLESAYVGCVQHSY
jgi:hypothetical protein